MKIKNVKINKFKRFTDLSISDIPETARLIVLVGPNGSGKTSIFEAFNHYYQLGGYGSAGAQEDRKSTRLNSSHVAISYAVFCLKKKKMTVIIVHVPEE